LPLLIFIVDRGGEGARSVRDQGEACKHAHTHRHTYAGRSCTGVLKIAVVVSKRSCPELPGAAIDGEREHAGKGSN